MRMEPFSSADVSGGFLPDLPAGFPSPGPLRRPGLRGLVGLANPPRGLPALVGIWRLPEPGPPALPIGGLVLFGSGGAFHLPAFLRPHVPGDPAPGLFNLP